MKKVLLMAALVLSSFAAKAQSEVGTFTLQPKVGMNISTLTGDGTKTKVGLVAGVEGMYQVSPFIGISDGLLYSMQGLCVDAADFTMVISSPLRHILTATCLWLA